MPELVSTTHAATDLVDVREVHCLGTHAAASAEECDAETRWVFPFRGVFVHHQASEGVVGDANQVLFFHAERPYRISHPVPGGDDCLSVGFAPQVLEEIAGSELEPGPSSPTMRSRRLPLTPRAQRAVAVLRSRARVDPLELEVRSLELARAVLDGSHTARRRHTAARRALVERTKLLLQADPGRRWSLAELAGEVGVSPPHLTETFSEMEGVSLYRYQTRLRLARALAALPDATDLTLLALDHGFSSHSHFTHAFRRAYGTTPSAMCRSLR
jgi:AraC family transcriptional regulator